MPHPESERGLQIQLATALRERDEWHHVAEEAIAAHSRIVAEQKRLVAADNATLSERDALRAEVKRLREALASIRDSGTVKVPEEMRNEADAALASGVDRG